MAGFADRIPDSIPVTPEMASVYNRMRRARNTINNADWASEVDLGKGVFEETSPALGKAAFDAIDHIVGYEPGEDVWASTKEGDN